MAWRCKRCGGGNFESVENKHTLSTNLIFDKEGFIEHDYDSEHATTTTLGCVDCDNFTIGIEIENIAEWED